MIKNPPFADPSAPLPRTGYWLANINKFASVEFNLFHLDKCQFELSTRNILNISHTIEDYHLNRPSNTPCFNNTPEANRGVHHVLQIFQSEIRDRFPSLRKFVPEVSYKELVKSRGSDSLPRVSNNDKSLLFLALAKEVVFSSETPFSIAAKYGVSATNVKIWVSIFLLYGDRPFKFRFKPLSPEDEMNIIQEYRSSDLTKVALCAKHLIFSINTFNNIRRRVRRRSQAS